MASLYKTNIYGYDIGPILSNLNETNIHRYIGLIMANPCGTNIDEYDIVPIMVNLHGTNIFEYDNSL